MLPRDSFSGPNKRKSLGAKSGLYTVCYAVAVPSHIFNFLNYLMGLVWWRVVMLKNDTFPQQQIWSIAVNCWL